MVIGIGDSQGRALNGSFETGRFCMICFPACGLSRILEACEYKLVGESLLFFPQEILIPVSPHSQTINSWSLHRIAVKSFRCASSLATGNGPVGGPVGGRSLSCTGGWVGAVDMPGWAYYKSTFGAVPAINKPLILLRSYVLVNIASVLVSVPLEV